MDDVKASMLRTVRTLLVETEAGRQTWEQGSMGEVLGVKTKLDGHYVTLAGGPITGTAVEIQSWRGPNGELEYSRAIRTFHGNAEATRLRRMASGQVKAAQRAARLPRDVRQAERDARRAADRDRLAASERNAVQGL